MLNKNTNNTDTNNTIAKDGVLQGLRVLVTRPLAQAQTLVKKIQAQGGQGTVLPSVEIAAVEPTAQIRRSIENLDQYQSVIFVSGNAARIGCDLFLDNWPQWPIDINWLAVGSATANAMAEFGLIALVPEAHDSEGLLKLKQLDRVSGSKILIVQGQGGRPLLAETLQSRGAIVDVAAVYCRQLPSFHSGEMFSTISQAKIDIVLITSGESLVNLCAMAGNKLADLQKIPLMVVSDRIAQIAKEKGFGLAGPDTLVISNGASDEAVLLALQQYVNTRKK
ncbi:MAG: uroporphyrinogen-III synthase [Pseudomonadales bacterium]|nr:uroporphyrinogen-III synthase [Pseudomonadales bacterium]